ncbi:hypothetical protein BH09BAC1_BH09BAC1_07050 [soil metagenome]
MNTVCLPYSVCFINFVDKFSGQSPSTGCIFRFQRFFSNHFTRFAKSKNAPVLAFINEPRTIFFMKIFNPARFLAALKEIMSTGIAAVALSESEIFFIANSEFERPDRIGYHEYLEFVAAYQANNYRLPNLYKAEAMEEVYLYLNAQIAKQKLAMLKAVKEGGKDYRRFCWLLERQEKQQRADAAIARDKAKEKRDQEKAAAVTSHTETANTLPNNGSAPMEHAGPYQAHEKHVGPHAAAA